MSKVKKVLAISLCILMLCVAMIGCGQNSTDKEASDAAANDENKTAEETNTEKKVLRVLGPGGFADVGEKGGPNPITNKFIPGYNEVIELFKKDFPDVELQLEAIPWDSWQAKLQTAAAGNLVDVMCHGASLITVAADLTEYMKKDADVIENLAVNAAVRYCNESNYLETSPRGIPVTLTPSYLKLDKKIFEDFNVELPNADTYTWDDILKLAEQLTGKNPKTGVECYGISYFGVADSSIWKPFMCYNWANGIEVVNFKENKFESEFKLDSDEVISSFDYFSKLVRYTPNGFLENAGSEKVNTPDNNIAMYMSEGPVISYNATVATKCEDQFVYIPLPKTKDRSQHAGFFGDWNLAIAESSTNKDLAWEFIKWMVSSEDVTDWLVRADFIPNNKKGIDFLKADKPYYDCCKKLLDTVPDNFFYATTKYWDNNFGTANSAFASAVTEMYSGKITPEKCAKTIQASIEEYINSTK